MKWCVILSMGMLPNMFFVYRFETLPIFTPQLPRGLAKEKAKDAIPTNTPLAIICLNHPGYLAMIHVTSMSNKQNCYVKNTQN